VEGWWESKICQGTYCIYTNRRIAKGRGLVAVTKYKDYQKIEQIENHISSVENGFAADPVPFAEAAEVAPNGGPGIVANTTIKRGKPLMTWTPVLIVHKDVFADLRKSVRLRLLEKAVSFLPDETREKFNRQRKSPSLGPGQGEKKDRTIDDILLAHPFEIDLGSGMRGEESGKHYVNYPEAAVFQHDCRPNVAFHIDNGLAHKTTVVRKTKPGEPLTIAYVDPLWPRKRRQDWVKKHRGLDKPCQCRACSGTHGDKKSGDDRLDEIMAIQAELKNHDSRKVDAQMIGRFVRLFEEDRLQAKLADAYELVATNYNYLGYDRLAKKYADLAVQAGIIENGPNFNDVVAMRIMASDVKGHWSYQFTLKRRGLVKTEPMGEAKDLPRGGLGMEVA